ncbi:MAG TPA: RyR domain-containing protein [Streptosporangiaceae bacterium]|nr:RyR domain-containing protein [Streptosporangiaceae bacterium]
MIQGAHRYRRLRVLWRQYRWAATGAMVTAVLILGIVGFGEYRRSPGTATAPLPYLDRLYDTVGLFSFSTAVTPPLPPMLEVARWLAPLAVAYVGFRALAAIFAEQWLRLRVRIMFRNHVIVLGLGRCGMRLAVSFYERGDRVVAVDRDPSGAEATACADCGIPLLRGDATDAAVLARTGLSRSRLALVVCGDEGTNAEVAILLTRVSTRRRQVQRVLVHIGDLNLCQLLEEAALSTLGRGRVRLEFFNVYRLGPSALLDAWQARSAAAGSAPPHIIVAGSGPVALNLVTEAVRRWRLDHRDSARQMRVTLIAPDAADRLAALRARLPALGGSADLTAVTADLADPAAPPLSLPPSPVAADGGPDSGRPDIAFACLETDAENVQAVIRLRHALPDETPVVACAAGLAGASLVTLLDRSASGYLANVYAFGLLDQICRADVVLNLESESIARAVHQDYVRRRLAQGGMPGSDPALAAWEDLPEDLRESNRLQVADIRAKLGAIGYEFTPEADWDAAPFELSAEQVEQLAQAEHDRWQDERRQAGWRYGPVRDASARFSPHLVPWEELSEDVRDLDRDAVRLIPSVLSMAGYAIVPLNRRGGPPRATPVRAEKSPAGSGQSVNQT